MKSHFVTLTLIGALGAPAAHASTQATAVTDLNLRAGPAPNHQVLTVIPNDGTVRVDGCIAQTSWCKVNYGGTEGWAYGEYLTAALDGQPAVIIDNRDRFAVEAVTYEASEAEATAAAGTVGAIIGGAVGGPAGAAVGAATGGAVGNALGEESIVYVRENATDPVYLDGEVVVGAQLPDAVRLRTIPQTDYTYANVNNVPVVVDPAERRVVHIVR